MRYMLLIYTDPELAGTLSPEAGEQLMGDYFTFTEKIVASGEMISGDPLQGIETATSVRVRDGRSTTTDGPFAETKEVLGGYYLVDVADLDRATELAGQIPGARIGTIEVRPVQELPAS